MPRPRIRVLLLGAIGFAALLLLERKRPLRRLRREPQLRRDGRNLVIAGMSAAAVSCCEARLVTRVLNQVPRKHWGILQRVQLPAPVRMLAAVALMDYTLYFWHYLVHRVPFLWRFHAVHHVDLDMDASTALRFHFGEMLISAPYRALQVVTVGVDQRSFTAWQALLFASILFHHSNLELPPAVERCLGWIITTPRMHGLHHAELPEIGACNWSSGLSIWDRLHGTLRWGIPQPQVGVQGIEQTAQVGIRQLTAMPVAPPDAVVTYGRMSARATRENTGREL